MEAIACGKTAVDTTNLRRYIQKLSAVDPETEMTGIEKQFKVTPAKSHFEVSQHFFCQKLAIRNELLGPALFKAANVEANHSKNRTTNIVPCKLKIRNPTDTHSSLAIGLFSDDTNRVMLMVTPGVEGSDYINASFVDVSARRSLQEI